MTNTPFLTGQLATLRQADMRREASDRRLAKEARRARKDRRRTQRIAESIRTTRNPQPKPRVVMGDIGGGRA